MADVRIDCLAYGPNEEGGTAQDETDGECIRKPLARPDATFPLPTSKCAWHVANRMPCRIDLAPERTAVVIAVEPKDDFAEPVEERAFLRVDGRGEDMALADQFLSDARVHDGQFTTGEVLAARENV